MGEESEKTEIKHVDQNDIRDQCEFGAKTMIIIECNNNNWYVSIYNIHIRYHVRLQNKTYFVNENELLQGSRFLQRNFKLINTSYYITEDADYRIFRIFKI